MVNISGIGGNGRSKLFIMEQKTKANINFFFWNKKVSYLTKIHVNVSCNDSSCKVYATYSVLQSIYTLHSYSYEELDSRLSFLQRVVLS